uniref:tRNA selenocysteine-associated protein 1 n=1 Tax=Steinernema glaseri TaxID=37863 RepID=A0A1I8A9H1_9BILA
MSVYAATERTLWMGDLAANWTPDFIQQGFAALGERVIVKPVKDRTTGQAAGYCFIEFQTEEIARKAMLKINGRQIPGTVPPAIFNLSFANSPDSPHIEYNLFVNNMPLDMDDAQLFLIFGERYRSCRGAKVYRNPDGSSRGLGFVRFCDQTDQQRALLEMNKFKVGRQELLLKLAQPKHRGPRNTPVRGYYSGQAPPQYPMQAMMAGAPRFPAHPAAVFHQPEFASIPIDDYRHHNDKFVASSGSFADTIFESRWTNMSIDPDWSYASESVLPKED